MAETLEALLNRIEVLESAISERDARIDSLKVSLKAVSEKAANFVPPQVPLEHEAVKRFQREFKNEVPKKAAYAPGRVNLIGEHTDYTGGFVLPVALEKRTVIVGNGEIVDASTPNTDCYIASLGMAQLESFNADPALLKPAPADSTSAWTNYVRGVVKQYSQDLPEGKKFCFKAVFNTDVPLGAGLSSSASLEVATATFLEQIEGVKVPSKEEKALRCQAAEHEYCNMPCGIMDQFISALGTTGHALMIDCRSNIGTNVKMASADVVILVTNSNVKHQLTGSEYPTRVKQCQLATSLIGKLYPQVKQLRDADMEMLSKTAEETNSEAAHSAEKVGGDSDGDSQSLQLNSDVYKRARHVISENDRVTRMVRALEAGDFKVCGELMAQSHNSLRDDFEVSCPELDILVEIANKFPGVYGSRMTGGGFGGCTVTLCTAACTEGSDGLIEHLKQEYEKQTKLKADCFVTRAGSGASVMNI